MQKKKSSEGKQDVTTRENVVIKPPEATTKHKGFNQAISTLSRNITLYVLFFVILRKLKLC